MLKNLTQFVVSLAKKKKKKKKKFINRNKQSKLRDEALEIIEESFQSVD